MNKYQFYLKCLEMFEDAYHEHGAITDQQWFTLINRVMDCVYEEIKTIPNIQENYPIYGSKPINLNRR